MLSENIVRFGWVTMNYFVDDFQGFSYCDYLAGGLACLRDGGLFVDDTTQFKISFPFKQYFSIIIFSFTEKENWILWKMSFRLSFNFIFLA